MNASWTNSGRIRRRNSRAFGGTKLELYLREKISSNPLQFFIAVSLSIGLVGILIRQRRHNVARESSISMKRESYILPGFPSGFIDIWPDHEHQSELLKGTVLQNNCIPSHHEGCTGRESTSHSHEIHVILLRSPGVFGRLLDDFFSAFVKTLGDAGKMIHTTHTVIPDDHHIRDAKTSSGTRLMIRLAVLPPALEAMDLALGLSSKDKQTPVQISEDDLTEALRLWSTWHCNISTVAKGTNKEKLAIPLLTVPLDLILAYPMKAEKLFAGFLGIDIPPDEKRNHVPMGRRISRALSRIDECYGVSMSLSIGNAPKVPDCSSVSSRTRLRKSGAPWVSLARQLLVEGESHKSVCRTAKDELPVCKKASHTQ